MIPKKIHYVWVGNAEKPELVQKCIASWARYCPDYEIVEWGNESLKDINNQYVIEAFNAKKWAFVSDYLRLYALYQEGGFYFDTDLELTNSIDKFRDCKYLTGYERSSKGVLHPLTALMGAEKHCDYIRRLLDDYADIHFIHNGVMDQTTNVMRVGRFMKAHYNLGASDFSDEKTLEFEPGHFIYPSYFFCLPIDGKINYSIHHFAASWLDPFSRKDLSVFKTKKGIYRFVRFRRRDQKAEDIEYEPGEVKLFSIPWFNGRQYVLTFKSVEKSK